ncbi:MAG: hypothetical protein J0H17_19535 [Rhizobiales bacterium]|nr:hypothetical protein [Hyphomicrobiales bacterium]
MNWLVDLQRWLYSGSVDALNGLHAGKIGTLPLLLATAFAFGVLHALLPGHGKAVLSAYYAGDGKAIGAIRSTLLLITVHVGSAIALVIAGFAIYERTLGGARSRAIELEHVSQMIIVAVGVWLLVSALLHHKREHSAPALAMAAGFIPCPLTTFVMSYAVAKNMTLSGVALSVAFATGMICTVSCFPLMAIAARKGLLSPGTLNWFGGAFEWGRPLLIASALMIIAIGAWPYISGLAIAVKPS